MNEIGQRTDVDQTGIVPRLRDPAAAGPATRSIAWGYDSKGQVVTADSTENAPNALNQYASITGSRSTGTAPTYDTDGNALTWNLTTDESGTISQTYYPTYDSNGNVSEKARRLVGLLDEGVAEALGVSSRETVANQYVDQTGATAAHFECDPFGNLTVDSQSNAASFAYRFSTKPQDPVTGLYYYGYRWYDAISGRWSSRDPIGERGGMNLYGFVGNDGVNAWDYLGLVYGRGVIYGPILPAAFEYGEQIVKDAANRECCVKDLDLIQLRAKTPDEGKSVKRQWLDAKIAWAIEVLRSAGIQGLPAEGTCLEPFSLVKDMNMPEAPTGEDVPTN